MPELEEEALDNRGRNITLGVFGAIILLIAALVFNNYRIKQDRIAGMQSADPALQAAKAREMMQGFTNNGHIAEQLQGERPSVRSAAVHALLALATSPNTDAKTRQDAAKLTVPFMKDSDQPVKDEAIQALTAMGPETAVDAVTEALNDGDGAVKGGAQTVCQNFRAESLPAILAFSGKNGAGARLRNGHRATAGNALVEIAKQDPRYKTVIILGEEAVQARERGMTPEQSHQALQQFLGITKPLVIKPEERVYGVVDYLDPNQANEDDQNNAISILDRMGDNRAVPFLIPRVDSPPTRRAAVGALGRIGDKRATPILLKYLPQDETNRQELVIALGKIADPAATDDLIRYGLGSVSAPVRTAAADSLRNIGIQAGPQQGAVIQKLIAAATTNDPQDPAAYKAEGAVRALAGLKVPAATQVAIGGLKHASNNVREAAAASLGESGDPSVIAPLINSFVDKNGRVAGFAATSVSALGAKAVPQLVTALSDPARVYWASRALGYVGAPAVQPLRQALLSGSPAGALAAANLLGDLGDAGAIDMLKQALATRPDPDFQFAASSSIQRLSGGSAGAAGA
jgi:HEAT repeat protein